MKELAKQMADKVKTLIAEGFEEVNKNFQQITKDYDLIIEKRLNEIKDSIPIPKDGEPGKDGENGKDVDQEAVIKYIDEQISKIEIPKDGKDGEDGRDGRDGRDSLELEILGEINPEKSYPRGTYALHKGGLFRAYESTKEMRGWETVVNGLDDIDIALNDDRELTVRLTKSNGDHVEKKFSLPIMIYRETHKEGEPYKKGDVVTSGGSMWIAQKDGPEGKPGLHEDWKLCVKRGRDGRESLKIENQVDKVKLNA